MNGVKERFTVTVTDFRGARHYALHQIVKRLAAGLLGGLALLGVAGAATIYLLNTKIDELERIRAEKAEAARQIEERNEELRELISERERTIHRMDLELGHIEALVGLEPAPDKLRQERLEAASQTALQKGLMLRTIPSGWPLREPSRITSGYGWRDHPITGERSYHAAVDLSADVGDPVLAAADGVVNFARRHKDEGLGNLVILEHDLGFRTHYAHLDAFEVKRGEFVEEGEVIARAGATGQVKGSHLHYEVWHLQRKLDPAPFLEWDLESYQTVFEQESRVRWESLAQGINQRAQALERQLSAMGHDWSEN